MTSIGQSATSGGNKTGMGAMHFWTTLHLLLRFCGNCCYCIRLHAIPDMFKIILHLDLYVKGDRLELEIICYFTLRNSFTFIFLKSHMNSSCYLVNFFARHDINYYTKNSLYIANIYNGNRHECLHYVQRPVPKEFRTLLILP